MCVRPGTLVPTNSSTWVRDRCSRISFAFSLLGDNKTQLLRLLHCDEGGNVPTMFIYHNQMLVRYSQEFEKMKADIAAKI